MPAFNKFNIFNLALACGRHNLSPTNLFGPTLRLSFTNTLPPLTATSVSELNCLVETNIGNTYVDITGMGHSAGDPAGVVRLKLADKTLTATGAGFGGFRYIVLWNEDGNHWSNQNWDLIGYWDYGSTITLKAGESITIDFDDVNGVLKID